MNVLQRAPGLTRAPRRTWEEIAAEGDDLRPLLTRYVPVVVLPPLALSLVLWVVLAGLGPQTRTTQIVRLGPDGAPVLVGTGTSLSLGGGLTALLLLAALAVGLLCMYLLVLANARRFGAVPDRAATAKLLAYAASPAVLGVLLLPVPLAGWLLAIAGLVATVALFRSGAPILLPPVPGEEGRFGRAVATRAALLALACPVAVVLAGVFVAQRIAP